MLLERSFQGFSAKGDEAGVFSAWAAIVDAILFGWDDFTILDYWIDWLEGRLKDGRFPDDPALGAQVAASMLGALVLRRPFHPDLERWRKRAFELAELSGDIDARTNVQMYALNYSLSMGDIAGCEALIKEFKHMEQALKGSPALVLSYKWLEAVMLNMRGSYMQALGVLMEELETAEKTGVHIADHLFYALGVYSALLKGDMFLADEFLSKIESTLSIKRRHSFCQFHYLAAWYSLLRGDLPKAYEHAGYALRFAEDTGMFFPLILSSHMMAQVHAARGDFEKAASELERAGGLASKSGSPAFKCMCLMAGAQFALMEGRKAQAALREALSFARETGLSSRLWWWSPSQMSLLAESALAEGIEAEYVKELIVKWGISPRTLHGIRRAANWPYPVRICTLGGFKIFIVEKPLSFAGKVQKRPLDMLKALVAFGPEPVSVEMVSDILWPEAEGDAAYVSFKSTLLRLRRLLGDEKTVLLSGGLVGLNRNLCRVDAWAFEEAMDEANALRDEGKSKEAAGLFKEAMNIYKGDFLPSDPEKSWMAPKRLALREKFQAMQA